MALNSSANINTPQSQMREGQIVRKPSNFVHVKRPRPLSQNLDSRNSELVHKNGSTPMEVSIYLSYIKKISLDVP